MKLALPKLALIDVTLFPLAGLYIEGTAGDDTLYGSQGGDFITGLGGNDILYGQDGDDEMHGDAGNDYLSGGAGLDLLDGGAGNDCLVGGTGADLIIGGAGFDTVDYSLTGGVYVDLGAAVTGGDATGENLQGIECIIGSGHVDIIHAGAAAVTLYAGDGSDALYGSNRADKIYGQAGNDEIHGNGGNDFIDGGAGYGDLYGEAGNDVIHGGADDDNIYGGDGNDALYGDGGFDWIEGGAGNDKLYGGSGYTIMIGGAGADRFSSLSGDASVKYDTSAAGISVNLLTNHASGGDARGDTFFNIHSITGSEFDDDLTAGLEGASLNGGGGDDTIVGGAGADSLSGDEGDDWLIGSAGDNLVGGAGADKFSSGDGLARVSYYEGGSSGVFVNLDANYASGGNAAGDTFYNIFNVEGSSQNDVLNAGAHAVIFDGGIGDDTLVGNIGNDVLRGGNDSDWLIGAGGDDQIAGEWGHDVLNGGTGADIFIFEAGDSAGGSDTIQDYAAEDSIGLAGDFKSYNTRIVQSDNLSDGRGYFKETTHNLWYNTDTHRLYEVDVHGTALTGHLLAAVSSAPDNLSFQFMA